MSWETCDRCGKRTSDMDMVTIKLCGDSRSSPAEYERVCQRKGCAPYDPRDVLDYDEAYARAAARYDGANGEKDWR